MTQAYDLDHAPIVLVQQRGKIALAMLGCLGFVALGVWLPVAAPGNTKAMLASVLAILFFGGLAVRGAASLAKPSIVTLASDGLGLETAFGARHVSWSDLEDISLVRIRRTQVVALKARTASGLSSGLYRALGLPGNSGLPGGLPIDQQDLYALLTRAKARWS